MTKWERAMLSFVFYVVVGEFVGKLLGVLVLAAGVLS